MRIRFSAERSALLIIDMQRYFLDRASHAFVPDAVGIVPKIKRLSEIYNKKALPVILTRHVNTDKDAGCLSQWWADLIKEKDSMSQIVSELDGVGDIIIKKTQYDAFYKTNLEDFLLKKRVKQVVITGVLTHLCCETTARSAFVRGFNVYFTEDCTATYDINFHKATLLNLSHGFADIVTFKEITDRIDG